MTRRVSRLAVSIIEIDTLDAVSYTHLSQGTPYYNMFRGEVEVKLMNEMGYDAMTIGNHEFDFDVDNMERIFKMANFPVVCANYNLDATVLKDIVLSLIHIFRALPKPDWLFVTRFPH